MMRGLLACLVVWVSVSGWSQVTTGSKVVASDAPLRRALEARAAELADGSFVELAEVGGVKAGDAVDVLEKRFGRRQLSARTDEYQLGDLYPGRLAYSYCDGRVVFIISDNKLEVAVLSGRALIKPAPDRVGESGVLRPDKVKNVYSPELQSAAVEIATFAKNSGLEMRRQGGKVFVNPTYWRVLTYDRKQAIMRGLRIDSEMRDSGLVSEICDGYSGKVLMTYGVLTGAESAE